MWSGRVGRVSDFFFQRIHFFWGGGGGVFFYKLTRNPLIRQKTFFFWGGGEGGGGQDKSMCMNKCIKWHFYSSKRTPVQNYFEIHACM